MTHTKILQIYRSICSLIEQRHLKQSLDLLDTFLSELHFGELYERKAEIEQTYRYMLSFSMEEIDDP